MSREYISINDVGLLPKDCIHLSVACLTLNINPDVMWRRINYGWYPHLTVWQLPNKYLYVDKKQIDQLCVVRTRTRIYRMKGETYLGSVTASNYLCISFDRLKIKMRNDPIISQCYQRMPPQSPTTNPNNTRLLFSLKGLNEYMKHTTEVKGTRSLYWGRVMDDEEPLFPWDPKARKWGT